jgi:hypothetical protein
MRETRTYGSVRGALSDGRPYRDPSFMLRCSPCGVRGTIANMEPLLSQDERIRLLERLKRLAGNPKIPIERKAGLFRSIRLLSAVIAREYRKNGRSASDYRIYLH